MRLHFSATGNFKQLQTSLHAVNRQVGQSMSGINKSAASAAPALAAVQASAVASTRAVGDLGQATAKVTPLINQMHKAQSTTGRFGFHLARDLHKYSSSIIAESKAIGAAQGTVMMDAAGNARVFMDVNRHAAENVATLTEKMRFMNTIAHGVGRNMVAMGKNIQWAGRQVTVGLTVPLGIAAFMARRVALEYNEQFTRILKVNNEASAAALHSAEAFEVVSESIRRQSDELVELGASMGFVSNETSAMVAELAQMGYAGASLNQLTEASLRLSRTAGTDLTTSLELSRLTAQAFQVPLDELTMTFARLNLIENNTALSLDELAKAMPVVAGVAATMGMEIAEVSGLMAMMKENGIGANEGATALRTGLLRIVQDATDPAIEAFAGIGLNLVEMQDRMNSLTSEGGGGGDVMFFFDELSAKLQEIEARGGDAAQIGLNDFAAAISKMVGVRSSARFLSFLKEVGDRTDSNTVAGRAWIGVLTDAEEAMRIFEFEERMVAESAAGIAKRLKAELNVELVKLGENFLATGNKAMQAVVNILNWFNSLSDGVKQSTLVFLGLVAVLGPATMMLGIFTNALGQIIAGFTKLFKPMNVHTIATQAQKIAHEEAAKAAGLEARALDALTLSLNNATRASGAYTVSARARSGLVTATTAAETARSLPPTATRFMPGGAAGAGAAAGTIGAAATTAGKALVIFKSLSAAIIIAGSALAALSIAFASNSFFEGLRRGIGDSAGNLAGHLRSLSATVGQLVEKFRTLGQNSESFFGAMAIGIGAIAGTITNILNKALSATVIIIERAVEAGGVLIDLANYVTSKLAGNEEEAQASLDSAGSTAMMWLDRARVQTNRLKGNWADGVGIALNGINEKMGQQDGIMGWLIDGAEELSGHFWDISNASRATVERHDRFQGYLHRNSQQLRENSEQVETFQAGLGQAQDYLQGLARAGVDVNNLTEKNVMANDMLTDELKAQVISSLFYEESLERILELEQKIARIRMTLVQIANAGLEGGIFWNHLQGQLNELQAEFNGLTEEAANKYSEVMANIEGANTAAAFLGDETGELGDEVDDVVESTEELEAQLEAINDKIRESERAAQDWASALKSSVGDVMSDIEAAVLAAFEEQREQMERQFEDREAAINNAAESELERIDAVEKAEEVLEEKRKRWFEQQKARIEYLKNMEQQNVRMGEMIARGDLAEASVIRIGLQRDAEAYMLDSYEREAEKYKDAKQTEVEKKRESVEEVKRLALEQLEAERAAAQAAYEARERSVRLYLESWMRITPATEQEFRRHLGNLTSQMNTFGINIAGIATHYTDISGQYIFAGFTDAISAAEAALAEDGKWRELGERTGKAYRDGLAAEAAKIEGILDDIRDGVNVTSGGGSSAVRGATTTGSYSGQTSRTWTPSQYQQYRGITTKPYTTSGEPPNRVGARAYPTSSSYSSSVMGPASGTGTISSIFQRSHSGGNVDARPNMPGLKSDESAYILQHGEYVVQRDAVNALGLDYMERINQAKRHDGGLIDYGANKLREAGAGRSLAGYAFGKLATLAAADIVRGFGGDPSIKKRDTTTRSARVAGKAAGKQIAEVAQAFGAQQGGEGSGAGWQSDGSGWPPRRWAQISPNTLAAQRFFQAQGGFPGGIGAGVHRGVQKSDHSWGKALDFMVAPLGRYARGEQKQRGWQVANWHIQNPNAFGTKYVIWDKMINSGDARGWRNYTRYGSNPGATLGHYDHVHVSYKHNGGLAGLRKGGKIRFDDTTARLHKGETVIDAPGTRAMENAVKLLTENAGGGGNVYELNIRVEGGNMNEQALAKAVMREIETAELRQGRKRVVRG